MHQLGIIHLKNKSRGIDRDLGDAFDGQHHFTLARQVMRGYGIRIAPRSSASGTTLILSWYTR